MRRSLLPLGVNDGDGMESVFSNAFVFWIAIVAPAKQDLHLAQRPGYSPVWRSSQRLLRSVMELRH